MLEGAQVRNNIFHQKGMNMNNGNWRGIRVEKFDTSNMGQFTTNYMSRLQNAITSISQSLKGLNVELASVNRTIADLERVIVGDCEIPLF